MSNLARNGFLFFFLIAATGLLSGCLAATIGSTLFTLLPNSYDFINKNSPSATQSIPLIQMEDVAIKTLKDLDFTVDFVKDDLKNNKNNLLLRSIVAHPSKAKKDQLKIEIQLSKITDKVTKIIVTAKDSSLSYDGATAEAILDEILINVELEKNYLGMDNLVEKADAKSIEQNSIQEERGINNPEPAKTSTLDSEASGVEIQAEGMQQMPVAETVILTDIPKPNLKNRMNSIITTEGIEKAQQETFNGLGSAPYTIKIGTFSNLKNVNQIINEWKRKGQTPFSSSILIGGKNLFRVFLNRYPDKPSADEYTRALKEGKLLSGASAQPFQVPYAIEVGECTEQTECERKVKRLMASGVTPYLHSLVVSGKKKRLILVGGYRNPEEANQSLRIMEQRGLPALLIKP